MYAVAYRHPEGFGSVGFLADFLRGGSQIRMGDPVFGWVTIPETDCFCLIETEGGGVLPAVSPALSDTVVSPWLIPGQEQMVANQGEVVWITGRETKEQFPSGYPLAWSYIKRWRLEVAPDWRTVALCAIFARNTIQRPIGEAESLYRLFGPTIRDAILANKIPGRTEMREMEGIAGTRSAEAMARGLDDVPSFEAIFGWAPWAAAFMKERKQYDRGFRDIVGVEWVPRGLGTAKLSFSMALLGRDAVCIDTRMEQYFFDDDKRLIAQFQDASGARSRAKGALGLRPSAIARYRKEEDKLAHTEYFDPNWPMPYAKAQWMLWETLGRDAGTADHSSLWEVLTPMLEEIP